ncbi:hypothetical protein F1880_000455 [Penicillium rolfsii]|nr:hypothetical protein F1880_000455 [Penicillium rolfsii]
MHFIIPIIVFVTANIWGLYSSIPFTSIDPARSIWDRTLGGVQLASTIYTLDQISRLLDEEAITHHFIEEYLGGRNAPAVSETESAMTLSAGHRPWTASLTVSPGFLPSPTSSTNVPVGTPGPSTTQYSPVDSLVQIMLSVIFALIVWLMVKQNEQTKRLTTTLEGIGLVQQYQETAWKGIYENHSNLAFLVSVAQDLRTTPAAHHAPAEEVDAQEQPHDSEGSTSSSDASSAVVIQTLQDVLASLDTLRQTINRSTDVWEGLSERLEDFHSGSQDTQPTDSTGDDPNGSSESGLAQDR